MLASTTRTTRDSDKPNRSSKTKPVNFHGTTVASSHQKEDQQHSPMSIAKRSRCLMMVQTHRRAVLEAMERRWKDKEKILDIELSLFCSKPENR